MAGIDPHIYFSAVAALTVAADIKPLKVEGFASETVELLITGTATVTFEAAGQLQKSDGTYYAIPATNLATGATSTTATASGLYRVDVRGFNWFRPRVSTYSSGAVSAAGNAVMVGGGAGTGLITSAAAALSDAAANPTTTTVGADMQGFNNTTWDKWRGNTDILPLGSGARTSTTGVGVLTNYNGRGIIISLNVTAAPATAETLTISVLSYNASQGVQTAAIGSFTCPAGSAGAAVYSFHVYPGISTLANPTANGSLSAAIGRSYTVQIVHSGGSSWTYSVGIQVVL